MMQNFTEIVEFCSPCEVLANFFCAFLKESTSEDERGGAETQVTILSVQLPQFQEVDKVVRF